MASAQVRRDRLAVVVAAVGTGIAMAAILAYAWYPTTLQPNIVLSDAEYTMASCVPYGTTTRYANRYDWVFTLTNSGQADGSATVRVGLGLYGLHKPYSVPRGSEVRETFEFYGAVHNAASECTGPENVTLSIASVSRVPPISNQALIGNLGGAVGTVGFTAVLLGIFAVVLRRRGQSLLSGWRGLPTFLFAFLIITAASFFSNAIVAAFLAMDGFSVNWFYAIVYGGVLFAIGLGVVYLAYRLAVQHAPRLSSVVTRAGG